MNTFKGSFWLRPGTSITPALIADISVCVSSHCERLPVMEGIYFNNNHVTASDTHNLRLLKMAENEGKIDTVIMPTPELIQKLKEFAFDEVEVLVYSRIMKFMFEDSPLEVEVSKWVYPPYMPVVNKLEKCKNFLSFEQTSLKDMLDFGKAQDTNILCMDKDKGIIKGKSFDCFRKVDKPDWEPDGAVCPLEKQAKLGFSLESLGKVSKNFKEEIIIGFDYKEINNVAGIWFRESGMDAEDELF